LYTEVAFIILFMKVSVFPPKVKKGGNLETLAKKMKGMITKLYELQKNAIFRKSTIMLAISATQLLAAQQEDEEEEEEDEEENNDYI
jgi:hypothetical protein